MERGPGAVRPPVPRDLEQARAAAVPLGDLRGEPAFLRRQDVGVVRAAYDDEFGGEGAQPLDLLDLPHRVPRFQGAQLGAVEQSVQCGPCDGVQVFGLAPGQFGVQPEQGLG